MRCLLLLILSITNWGLAEAGSSFNHFADSCLTKGADDYLVKTYRQKIDNGEITALPEHLDFLAKLFKRADPDKPTINSYYVCFYASKIITKHHLDNSDMPLQYLNGAIHIAGQLDDKALLVRAYMNRSSFYRNVRHDLLKAQEDNTTAREYLANDEKLKKVPDYIIDLNIGSSVTYYYLNETDKAVAYINESIAICKRANNPRKLYDLYKRRAFCEIELAEYPEALKTIDSAEAVVQPMPRNASYINHLRAMRYNVYAVRGDHDMAREIQGTIDAESLRDDNDDYYDYMYNLIAEEIHFELYAQAEKDISQYTSSLKEWNIQRWRKLYELKYLLYKKQNNFQAALEAYERFKMYDDTVHHQQQNGLILQQEIKYETKEKEKSLQAQKAINSIYFWLIISVSGLASVIIVLIHSNYRKGRRNIAALTSLNKQVNEQKSELEETNKDKDRILHVVAHDLRNPVGAIMNLAEVLQMRHEHDPEQEEILKMIEHSASHSLGLISELLEINEVNNADSDPVRQRTPLLPLMYKAVAQVAHKAEKKLQTISIISENEHLHIFANEAAVTRVLVNLLDNAIKFSHTANTISLKASYNDEMVQIEISDNGIGIPAALQPRIFDSMSAAKRKGTSGERSIGLGLSICRQIIEKNNGTITVQSEENKGTAFIILLPTAAQ
jgi:signal transduction histidine kinase